MHRAERHTSPAAAVCCLDRERADSSLTLPCADALDATPAPRVPPDERLQHPPRPQPAEPARRHVRDPAAVMPRWLDEAKWSSRTTWASSSPGFASSWAAQATRVRSITRLRLGAPPAPNCRERCSRLTSRRRASSEVRSGRSTSPNRTLHAALLERLGQAEHSGCIGQRAAPLGGERTPGSPARPRPRRPRLPPPPAPRACGRRGAARRHRAGTVRRPPPARPAAGGAAR